MLSPMEQLMLRCEKASEAAANTATSSAPACQGAFEAAQIRCQRRVGDARSRRGRPAKTASLSAICGTQRGLTKLPVSMVG
jgi:hypothetical protein